MQRKTGRFGVWLGVVASSVISGLGVFQAPGAETSLQFQKDIQPILEDNCYECHGEGKKKGDVAFDQLPDPLQNRDLWFKVLKNIRTGLMPPAKKPRPSAEERDKLEKWIKYAALGLDAEQPDPGRVTIRRLNRVEYRNTIRDLTGFDFKVEEELPPDDTGYGFDNIGDVLSISPLLLEKYMQAAETIVAGAVPRVSRVVAEQTIPGTDFRAAEGKTNGDRLSFDTEANLGHVFRAGEQGSYRLSAELQVLGQFDFDPGRCRAVFTVDGKEAWEQEFGWQAGKKFNFEVDQKWEAGEHRLGLEIHPLTPVEQKKNALDLRLVSLRVQGPTEQEHWVRPPKFDRFFTQDPPEAAAGRRAYAAEVLGRFMKRAYRRPVAEAQIDRLVALAEKTYTQPGKDFEDGIAQALVPVLASPRFLFRVEEAEPSEAAKRYAAIDEWALASRLSYFLWSTMPDEELFRLAEGHELRANLGAQVTRMVADSRADALVANFTGQWLQTRDVEEIDINAAAVFSRDNNSENENELRRKRFLELQAVPDEQKTPEQKAEIQEMRRRRQNRPKTLELDGELRGALRDETQMVFGYVMREDRSVLEFLRSDYTFLNEKLAKLYALTDLGVTGPEMRRVNLPAESPRGGVITEGSTLIVTSNPTRTSPVKRGLFILDNILGIPPPPPPANIPPLEDAEKDFKDHAPTLKEVLEVHRKEALCSSCHNRLDPLGLALENFNALGVWREKERGQPIDAAGQLITGETFNDIREVKRVLVEKHRLDFFRCLTEKLLTYALGRGLEYYDVETVDRIVAQLDKENGRFSTLLQGVVESAPFQQRRNLSPNRTAAASPAAEPSTPTP